MYSIFSVSKVWLYKDMLGFFFLRENTVFEIQFEEIIISIILWLKVKTVHVGSFFLSEIKQI